MVEAIVRGFPWPKSMIWGTKKLRWVRPLKRILCVFDREVVPFAIEGIESGDLTEGHRFMRIGHGWGGQPFKRARLRRVQQALAGHYVVLDVEERKARILEGARPSASPGTSNWSRTTACSRKSPAWPNGRPRSWATWTRRSWTCRRGDPHLDAHPPEVLRRPRAGDRRPGPALHHRRQCRGGRRRQGDRRGNAKVLSSRLSDARFFWDEDIKVGFDRGWRS
jgi:glycyl-tRNA synthetase beta chain